MKKDNCKCMAAYEVSIFGIKRFYCIDCGKNLTKPVRCN